MDQAGFWRLIDEARSDSGGDCEELVARLEPKLVALPTDELEAFDRTLDNLTSAAYRWDLWGAAYLINGGCSDDGFYYFRAWLVAQGREVFEHALKDPDSLADLAPLPEFADGRCECEDLLYVAGSVYRDSTGQEMSWSHQPAGPPLGEPWKEENLDHLFPRITAALSSIT